MLANAAAMTAVVTLLVSLLAPFVESLPGLADGPRHDAALRLLNIALQLAVVFLLAAATSGVGAADVLPLVLQALAQAAGAHFAYHVVTKGSAQTGALPVQPAAASTTYPAEPADFPPAAPSVAALGLPTTEAAA